MRKFSFQLAVVFLVVSHLAALFAGFVAPYDFAEQNRDFPYAPPCDLHLIAGASSLRLVFHPWRVTSAGEYRPDSSKTLPILFFTHGSRYPVLGEFLNGWTSDLHLIGTDHGGKIFLLGTDAYGRDQFSRLLFGARISLLSGFLAAGLAVCIGSILGAVAGRGGWLDEIIMRVAEVFLSVPTLYLLFAARALLPLKAGTEQVFLVLVSIIGISGWARPARLVRGVVLSVKERGFVTAARTFGGTELYLFRRHILPHVSSVALTQCAVLIPQYMLAEVTLSFAGLGVNEPAASWGNMLTPLQQYSVLENGWWMFAPAVAAIPVTLAYYLLSLEYGGERTYLPSVG